MGLLNRLLTSRPPAPEQRNAGAYLQSLWDAGIGSAAGPHVSEESALRMSAVWGCIRVISESVAYLPLNLYRQDGRGKSKATEHPLYELVHNLAGPNWTSFEWREWMMSEVLRWGNAFVRKVQRNGVTTALEPLYASRMTMDSDKQGRAYYLYRNADQSQTCYAREDIHHLRGLGTGAWGYSPIGMAARQAISLGLATESYGAKLFVNGARPGLIYRHPAHLSDKAYERLKLDLAGEMAGVDNAHKTKILEEGMEIEKLSFPPDEAQFLETRRFQIEEIARIYRVPLHMLQDLSNATFSNIEHQSLDFVKFTLGPWLVRHEQAMYRDFLEPSDRHNLYFRYMVQGLERGDYATRMAGYNTGIMAGYLTRNEAREFEDLNPEEGLDEFLVPLNMIEVGAEPPTEEQPGSPLGAETQRHRDGSPLGAEIQTRAAADPRERQGLMRRNVRLFEDAAGRLVKRETADVRRATEHHLAPASRGQKRSRDSFKASLRKIYAEIEAALPGYFRALMEAYQEEMFAAVAREVGRQPAMGDAELRKWLEEYLSNYAIEYARRGEMQLLALLDEAEDDEEAAGLVYDRLDGWEETEAQKQGLRQAFEAGNALALLAYGAAAVLRVMWMATGSETCPFCESLNGQVREVGAPYVEQGDEMDGGEGVTPLAIERDMSHPPIHQGCSCVLISV